MRITPIDIQQQQFKTRPFGYEKFGVDHFLEMLAEEVERLNLENQQLKDELVRTRSALDEMRQREATLKETLLTTQKVTDDLMMEFYRPLQTLIGRRTLLHFANCLDTADLTRIELDLKKLSIPVNVVWGAADRHLPSRTPEALRALFPSSTLHRIETAGHLVPLDEPARLVEVLTEALGRAKS